MNLSKKPKRKLAPQSLANLIPAQKGEVRNPEGARSHDPEMRKLRTLTRAELVEIGNLVLKNNIKQLKAISKDDDATVLKRMLASIAYRIIIEGNMEAFDKLLNRMIGKVQDDVKFTGIPQGPTARVVVTLPDNGRSVKIEEKK